MKPFLITVAGLLGAFVAVFAFYTLTHPIKETNVVDRIEAACRNETNPEECKDIQLLRVENERYKDHINDISSIVGNTKR